jgi:hypothetical protein
MSKKVIFLILLGASAFFASMEYLINPPKTANISSEKPSVVVPEADSGSDEVVIIKKSAFIKNVNLSSFVDEGISDVQIKDLVDSDYYFRDILINKESGEFSASSAMYYQKETPIIKITEFHADKEMTSSNIFSKLKEGIQSQIGEEVDKLNINQTNTFGDHSFYYNNTDFADMVFLLAKKDDVILAFEYKKENHENLKKVIENIFSEKKD